MKLFLALLTLLSTAPATAVSAAPTPHVFLLVLENHSYNQVIGNPNLTTFNALIKRGALARHYTGVAHPSLPNYVALIAGSTLKLHGDDPAQSFAGPTLASQLEAEGLSWKGYMQGLPIAGSSVPYAGVYAKKHNPFMLNADIANDPTRAAHVVPFEQLQSDLKAGHAPNFALLVPDLCHDLHGDLRCLGRANVERLGDAFLKTWADRIMTSSIWTPGAALIVTFDEGEDAQGGGGRVPTLILTPDGQPGMVSDQPYNHYSLLRSIEDHLGVPPLREAAHAAPMTDLWPFH
ncbi:alkaline phosphatase family protein [Deinococcus alpinitundrae]|uniref:alkaline phosphatase family protein n=1 Tax=Deinococcus alpinitundrae TaxID=468913 RepID=UPI001379AEE0|nr:alkaline phosphatase family protein [Deinococcus alpinitundrae]